MRVAGLFGVKYPHSCTYPRYMYMCVCILVRSITKISASLRVTESELYLGFFTIQLPDLSILSPNTGSD
jgi:hypothetical protein